MASTRPSSSLRFVLHSTGKNSTRWPDCSWNLGKHLVRICETLSRSCAACRPMVDSSMTPPTPCTTNTAWVTSGSRSAALQSSLYPRKILYPATTKVKVQSRLVQTRMENGTTQCVCVPSDTFLAHYPIMYILDLMIVNRRQ